MMKLRKKASSEDDTFEPFSAVAVLNISTSELVYSFKPVCTQDKIGYRKSKLESITSVAKAKVA